MAARLRFIAIVLGGVSIFDHFPSGAQEVRYTPKNLVSFKQVVAGSSFDERRLELFTIYSPDWRVTELRGAKIAEPRNSKVLIHKEGAVSNSQTIILRVLFSPYLFGGPERSELQRYSVFDCNSDSLKDFVVKVWKEGNDYWSKLIIKAGNIRYEFTENGPEQRRLLTDLGLEFVREECGKAEQYESHRFITSTFAHQLSLEPRVHIESSKEHSSNRISGYINPGEEGFIVMKVFDKGGSSKNLTASSPEYVGWSENPEQGFYFETDFVVSGPNSKQDVTLEIWFQPRYEKRLLTIPTSVETWTR